MEEGGGETIAAAAAAEGAEFSPWISCIAAVSFHATRGHVVDSIHPQSNRLFFSSEFQNAIARLSLPDMTIEREGDVKFTFRVRSGGGGNSFYFGAVFFRQQRDETEKRGYMQRSVVVLTKHHEFVSLASELAHVVAPVYFSFQSNAEVLERACAEVEKWPLPSNSNIKSGALDLVVAGTTIHYHRPSTGGAEHAMFADIPLFSTLGSLSVSLWALWELALTGQSILVLGPTPDRCSRAVLGICSLIAPIPFSYDFRPFLTVLDSDYSKLSKPDPVAPPCIVGGCNPFLLKSFEHFPNMVSLGSSSAPPVLQSGGLSPSTSAFVFFRKTQTLRSLLKNNKWETPLLITREKLLVAREDKVLQRLKQQGGTNQQNDELLRAHFYALTKRFLLPLESFLRHRTNGIVRAYQDTSGTSFSSEAFMQYLGKQGQFDSLRVLQHPMGTMGGEGGKFPVQLYAKFIAGPNFKPWLELELGKMRGERFVIMRTLIVETSSQALLGIDGMLARVEVAVQTEGEKKEPDSELYAKMLEHLTALRRQQQQEREQNL